LSSISRQQATAGDLIEELLDLVAWKSKLAQRHLSEVPRIE
jgi:hypothetical protein